ncbi:hypothetical protein Zmor_023693 [Zophobas morio]|uniref:CHK kinase-like domain-containing protein n=1 Tax=Zophobas morio TaxID=2755281 RepID=A0AA38HYJ7_9CUCU|nr:hypothetical protein Zmor_023693 [Zophobas morio]
METKTDRNSDIRKWLKVALAEENLESFSVKITGSSEKGDGYVGDVFFLVVTGIDKQGKNKEYDLVLKCSKSSAALMESVPVFTKGFVREAYLYQHVFPLFKQFQISKGIEKLFDSVPKYYGVYSDDFRHVIVLENLKKLGYDLWPKAKPLSREVIDIVIKNYAKFHATSVALEEQCPENFQKLLKGLAENLAKEFIETSDFANMFQSAVEEVYELLTEDVKKEILEQWLKLKEKVYFIFGELISATDDLKVISHGDSWVNNFLYKFENEEKTTVSRVAILDWQVSKFTSPVTDLSYFLFAGISKEDLADIDTILRDYYKYLCEYLRRLSSKFADTYTLENFFDDWKKYGQYGLVMCIMPIKTLYSKKKDLPDLAEIADRGLNVVESLKFETSDKNGFKNRLKPIVEYAVKNNLV